MPIKFKTDVDWGHTFYIKNDPLQLEHSLVGIVLKPGGAVKFELSHKGDVAEVYDFEASSERDEIKMLTSSGDTTD